MKLSISKSGIYTARFYLFILSILLGCLVIMTSCNKDKDEEDQPSVMDAESVYNIELQEQYAETFNSLIFSLDTNQAADSILKLFLADPHVVSGEVSEQAIFVDYINGSRGGIFFDPQDSPEAKSSSFSQTYTNSERKDIKIIPGSKLTILINPHYYERKDYTDPLLETYDNLFPGIGYEQTERYFNEDCTLELFTRLADYGFIHIYSHGIRSEEYVYLMTGESPNANSHKTYNKYLSDNVIVCLTSLSDSITRYYILPEFIADNNDFTINKPLVYGGYCYGFLGAWPEMFEYIGAEGYFSFDWAVRTARSVSWAESIISYLTDYSVDEPYSAWWWMQSSPVDKSYWAENHNRNVSIHYDGVQNLTLWNWEELGSKFNSFSISIKVNAMFEDSDGTITNEVWELPLSLGLGHDFTFTGNNYSSSWQNELFFDRTRTGDVEISLRPDGKTITYFSLNDSLIVPANSTFYFYNIKLANLPFVSEDDTKAVYEISGPNVCNVIEQLAYRKEYILNYSTGWKEMTSYDCSSPETIVTLILNK